MKILNALTLSFALVTGNAMAASVAAPANTSAEEMQAVQREMQSCQDHAHPIVSSIVGGFIGGSLLHRHSFIGSIGGSLIGSHISNSNLNACLQKVQAAHPNVKILTQ